MSEVSASEALSVLLVDDDDRFRQRLAVALSERGLHVVSVAGVEPALEALDDARFDAAVTDLKMPGVTGLQFVEQLVAKAPAMSVVVLTGYGTIATAVQAMRVGAKDYLVKPCNADQVYSAMFDSEPATDEAEMAAAIPSLARLEREHIERVLVECDGNISKAARVLGIHRRTLQYKLAKFAAPR